MADIPPVERIEPHVVVHKLGPDQWQVYRDLRREMLEKDPMAYPLIAHESAEVRTDEDWQRRFGESEFLAAFDGNKPIGIVGYDIKHEKRDDRDVPYALLSNMYVNGDYRGKGIGDSLVEGFIKHALKDVNGKPEFIRLEVEKAQEAAQKLYQKNYFSEASRSGEMITMERPIVYS